MARTVWLLVLGAAVAVSGLGGTASGGAQQNGSPGMSGTQQGTGSTNHPPRLGDGTGSDLPLGTQERMGIARMNERQKLLIADTDKLLELALALKKDVDKTDKNMLSLDVVKRAEAIEKLARSVKEREKGTK